MRRAVVALALAAMPAWAHLGGGEGVTPFVEGGVVVGAGTTWGLVDSSDGAYSQTCEEAIGDVPRAFVRVPGDAGPARVIAATGNGVVRTDDAGCTWQLAEGTDGRAVLALLTLADGRLVGITGDPGRENHVLASDDGGASFSVRHTTSSTVLLTSLAVGPDDTILVAGADTAAAAPLLLFGEVDALAPLSGVLEGARLARALAVDADAVWASTLDGIGRGHLLRLPLNDGVPAADNVVDVGAFDGLVRATGTAGGFRFAIAASGVLFRATDDGAAIAPDGWTRTTEGPLACLRHVDGDDRLWGCATQLDAVWFKATRDGVTWESVLPFAEVGDRECPTGTPAARFCAYRFVEPIDETPAGGTPPTPPPTEPSCAAGGAPAAWLGWLFVLAIGPRRRRD